MSYIPTKAHGYRFTTDRRETRRVAYVAVGWDVETEISRQTQRSTDDIILLADVRPNIRVSAK